MKNTICEMLGIEFPVLAFSHCRDVVAAVTNAGGFGVLGASGHSPEELELELKWIDQHVGGRPYGADIVVPEKYEGKGQHLSTEALADRVPQKHRDFAAKILTSHGVPTPTAQATLDYFEKGRAIEHGEELLEVALRHPIKLIANALGVPPDYMLERAHAKGVPVAALVGAKDHAVKQVQAGVDVIVAQGYEAGGHTGEVTTFVLVPEVLEAIAPIRKVPVLAAGGVATGRQIAAAIALGAAGVWTGSVWLTTPEAETAQITKEKMVAASSRDTLRSKYRTGKYSRQLRTAWHDAWSTPGSPEPLPMPLMGAVAEPALRLVDREAEKGNRGARELATYWVGQAVGLMNSIRSVKDVMLEMKEDYATAVERVSQTVDFE